MTAIDHTEKSDAVFIEQVIGQTSEMKQGFKEHGHDPYDLPENFVISVYPAVFIRLVDLLERAYADGFNRRPT